MQLCGMIEDDDGESCRACWERYLWYVASGRKIDPYAKDRIYSGGLIG